MEALSDQIAPLLWLPETVLGFGSQLEEWEIPPNTEQGEAERFSGEDEQYLDQFGFSFLFLMTGFKWDLEGFYQKLVEINLEVASASNQHWWLRGEYVRENTW